jgi:hypothetical protein
MTHGSEYIHYPIGGTQRLLLIGGVPNFILTWHLVQCKNFQLIKVSVVAFSPPPPPPLATSPAANGSGGPPLTHFYSYKYSYGFVVCPALLYGFFNSRRILEVRYLHFAMTTYRGRLLEFHYIIITSFNEFKMRRDSFYIYCSCLFLFGRN